MSEKITAAELSQWFDQTAKSLLDATKRSGIYYSNLLLEVEFRMITLALHDSHGNISMAAMALGMHRPTLDYKIIKCGVNVHEIRALHGNNKAYNARVYIPRSMLPYARIIDSVNTPCKSSPTEEKKECQNQVLPNKNP